MLVAITLSTAPVHAFASGVDAVVIIPLYVILFVLSVIAFGRIDMPTKSLPLALICGLLLFLNWMFSLHIYLKWLSNLVDSLEVGLVSAAITPFLIVHFTNLLTRRIR
ncbi:MAG: hypothetical protein KDI68_11725 [Gammaproteobacteria bacterium]|nr:hypothetical protein [Gammaproteobacteria bacterium]